MKRDFLLQLTKPPAAAGLPMHFIPKLGLGNENMYSLALIGEGWGEVEKSSFFLLHSLEIKSGVGLPGRSLGGDRG